MKIQEVCKRTGLSKRNIHFYIKEKLLLPEMNEENGYYNFCEKDFHRLLVVRELRRAGMAISSIRSILNTPTVAGYYLRIHANQLKKEIRHQEQIVESMEYILGMLPVNPTLENVFEISQAAGIPEPLSAERLETYESGDHSMVNQFLWMGFLPEEELTEYQQYLWNKLNYITGNPDNQNYRKIKQFLSALPQEQLDLLLTYRHQHERQIAAFDEEQCCHYIENMKEAIRAGFAHDCWMKHWKENYELYYYPMSDIYDSDVRELVAEISPWFSSYLHNIHLICGRLYDWLYTNEGAPFRERLYRKLSGYLDLEHCHHCELEALYSIQLMEGFPL